MTRLWNDLEGVSFAGRYRLERCLTSSDGDAWYQTSLPDSRPAAMRVAAASEERLELWREAASIEHPNLVRMLDAGRVEIDGSPFLYAVCEFPDDFLAGVLQDRPLSPAEAREVLRVALPALRFVHARGLVHRAVDPAHIMAFGETVKLPSDTWERPGTAGERRVGPYDPPEAARGVLTPAADVWALAIALHEMLTQQRPNLARDSEFRYMAEPFATILRRSLVADPERRCTVEDIFQFLEPAPAAPQPVAAPPAAGARPGSQPPPVRAAAAPSAPVRPFSIRWVPVVGLVAAFLLGIFFLRKPEEPSKPTAPATPSPTRVTAPPAKSATTAPVRNAGAPPLSPRPSSMPPVSPAATAKWRVVAYTYNSRVAAQKKVDSIARTHPGFEPRVFSPFGEKGPFFVALGGWMARSQADVVRTRARAQGLPRDMFVRNFSR